MLLSLLLSTGIIACLTYYLVSGSESLSGDFYLAPLTLLFLMSAVIFVITIIYLTKHIKIRRARKWPTLMGRIRDVRRERGKYLITYRYTYEDRDYFNDQFDLTQKHATKGLLKMLPEFRGIEQIDELEGKMIKVYFNPENISDSVISTRLEQNPWFIFVPAYTVIGISFYFLIRLIHSLLSLSGAI